VAEFPHPDLIQSGVKQATQGNRYQFYAGACYLLYASTAAMQGASGLTVKFFTNENPDADGGDELKAVLPAPSIREDAPDLYFPHGLYIEVEGVNGNSDVALVEANWVARADYCRAYPQVAETLTKCWSETRPDDPFLSKFDEGAPDDGDWDNEGAAGSGGVSGAPTVISSSSDPTVNDDSGDGYSIGDLWVNTTDDSVFILADATEGAAVWTGLGGGGGGASDHGALTGLTDDDHTQYLLADGTRALSGDLQMDANNIDAATTVNLTGDVAFTERSDHASTPAAGGGYVWVKNDTPSSLYFTDDAGNDVNLSTPSGVVNMQFRFHQGPATFNTAQEELILYTDRAITVTKIVANTTRAGGTGTSSSGNYWKLEVWNGTSAGSSIGSWQSHDGVSTADDMSNNLDIKDFGSLSNTSVAASTKISLEVSSVGTPQSQNTDAFFVWLYYTIDQ
jgi:hypothetical protein